MFRMCKLCISQVIFLKFFRHSHFKIICSYLCIFTCLLSVHCQRIFKSKKKILFDTRFIYSFVMLCRSKRPDFRNECFLSGWDTVLYGLLRNQTLLDSDLGWKLNVHALKCVSWITFLLFKLKLVLMTFLKLFLTRQIKFGLSYTKFLCAS